MVQEDSNDLQDGQQSIEERAKLVSDELSRQEEDQESKVKVLADQLKKIQVSSASQMDNSAVLHERR